MKVPFFTPTVPPDAITALADVLATGQLTTGRYAHELEQRLAQWSGVEHALAVNSGTAALHLALVLSNVGPGDAVFLPTLAFAADYQVVEQTGATAVLVDSEESTLCMSPPALEESIRDLLRTQPSLRPRAVIVIDYAGQMADYASLQGICSEWGLALVEDAAHALPAAWRNNTSDPWHRPGTVADFACLSFYATKPVTTGEGGALLTRNRDAAERARAMSLHGLVRLSHHVDRYHWKREIAFLGFKYNLPDLLAALGVTWMEQLDADWNARRGIVAEYSRRLGRLPQLRLPTESSNRRHAWHLYVARLPRGTSDGERDGLVKILHERGIEVSVHWYPLHKHCYLRNRIFAKRDFPVADDAYASMLSLPLFPSMSEAQIAYVCDEFDRALQRLALESKTAPAECRI